MRRVGFAILAKDRTGIVAEVLESVRQRSMAIDDIWSDTKCGAYLLAIGLVLDGDEQETQERVDDLAAHLESTGLKVVVTAYDGRGIYEEAAAFRADIAIEGDRRDEILLKTVSVIANEQANISCMRTEEVEGNVRFVVQARYDEGRPVKSAVARLSKENGVEFVDVLLRT